LDPSKKRRIFSFDGSNIVSTVGANYEHVWTSLGSIKNVPIALGDYYSKNKKDAVFRSDQTSVQNLTP